MTGIYAADKIFTGEEWLNHHAMVVQDDVIVEVLPIQDLLVPITQTFSCLVPAFIDAQIYGADEKLLAVHPNANAVQQLQQYCKEGGALHFIPTVATNTKKVIHQCIDAVKQYWQQGGKGCLGLHVEGPWINSIKRGAHIEALIHAPTVAEVRELLEYGKDVIKIVTLAPEVCSNEVIALIKSYGIIISVGHSNISYQAAMHYFDEGMVTTITHLYNAMSALQHREPGLVGAAFNHPTVMASIIPDGYHVDYAAIKIAKQIMRQRLFVITDAVTTTNQGYYQHKLVGDKYESNNILSGSALTMKQAIINLVQHCGITLEEALRMGSLYPAQALGLSNTLGKLEVGYQASFIEWEL
jgi:N-acetylglucosamine-6-phosphate deacetylase